jgi:lipopolysaccharide transport system permease protein
MRPPPPEAGQFRPQKGFPHAARRRPGTAATFLPPGRTRGLTTMTRDTSDNGDTAIAEGAAPVAESAAPRSAEALVIEAGSGWRAIDFRELWRFRELLATLVWRDVTARYRQTWLGFAWVVLQPVLVTAVFAYIFTRFAQHDVAYPVPHPLFIFSGLVVWLFFSHAIGSASGSILASEHLIGKVHFPRLAIPFASVAAALVDFLVTLVVLAGLMAWYGVGPRWEGLLLLPVSLAVTTLAAVGFGALLAALNVVYRDVRYIVPFMIQVWMFLTLPSIAMQTMPADPAAVREVICLNPIAGQVLFFRAAALGLPLPWASFVLSAVISVAVFAAGCYYFRRIEDSFADII